ncbi:MAG: 2-aminoethylphosphonate aminotransferase [Gammaproteobacteria bacterium]|nr:2-aminoethylphosphonate aminotransferase [Gammaproteobacteria bacterium]
MATAGDRQVLLNPGPVTLSDTVRAALGRGDWCHREPEFAALARSINARLAGVHPALQDDYDAVLLTGSGTAAVEGMLASFAPRRRTTLVLANGVYGERMARMLAAHGRPHRVLAHDWLAPPDIARLEAELACDADISHVAVVHHETTTGRLNDLEVIGQACKAWGVQLLLDGVSSFGAEYIAGRDWNLAAVAATANKCLHGVPGLSFVVGRRDLWRKPGAAAGSLYLDLRAYHAAQHGDGFSPFTQAVQVAFALDAALDEHAAEGGWSARRERYRARAERISATLQEQGVGTLLAPAEFGSVLWSYRLPGRLGYAALHDALKARGFVIYAGQGRLAADIFRIAHMGDIRPVDLERLCQSLHELLGGRGR